MMIKMPRGKAPFTVSPEQEATIRRLKQYGTPITIIASDFGCSHTFINKILAGKGNEDRRFKKRTRV